MALRALLLDVGNTLLREEPARFEIYAQAARSRGRNVTPQTMERIMRQAHGDIPTKIRGAFRYSDPWFRAYIHRIFCQNLGLAVSAIPDVTEELFARFEDPQTFVVFPGARELLLDLRGRGVKTAVVSNWSARLPGLLDGLGLTPLFDTVVCSAIEEMEKPEPSIFAAALERVGVPAADALHVGDHPEKDGAARKVGIDFILMDHFERDPGSDLPRATSFAALSALLETRLAS